MTILVDAYRRLVPPDVRNSLWHVRSGFWGSIAGPNSADRRLHYSRLRTALGYPVATISINGFLLRVDLRDEGVGRAIYVNRAYECDETAYLERTLKPGMTFVDIGANLGYYSTLAARAVGSSGRVVAFEPEPRNFAMLGHNIKINALQNVDALNLALGPCAEDAFIYLSEFNFGDHRLYADGEERPNPVPVRMKALDEVLDELCLERVDFIKMDVQGYELNVVRGMRRLLRRSERLTLLLEFWPSGIEAAGGSPSDLLNVFASEGYVVAILNAGGQTREIRYEDVFSHVPKVDPLRVDHSYVNIVLSR